MASGGGHGHGGGLGKVKHFVVIYEENHSFDNLYGGWERVNGLRDADRAHTRQVNQAGAPYQCLLQNDVNLTSPPLSARCTNTAPAFSSHFFNKPFRIEDYIAPEDTTCPAPGVFAPNGVLQGHPAQPGRLHARPRAPLLPGAVPARRRPAGPLRDRLATPSA